MPGATRRFGGTGEGLRSRAVRPVDVVDGVAQVLAGVNRSRQFSSAGAVERPNRSPVTGRNARRRNEARADRASWLGRNGRRGWRPPSLVPAPNCRTGYAGLPSKVALPPSSVVVEQHCRPERACARLLPAHPVVGRWLAVQPPHDAATRRLFDLRGATSLSAFIGHLAVSGSVTADIEMAVPGWSARGYAARLASMLSDTGTSMVRDSKCQ